MQLFSQLVLPLQALRQLSRLPHAESFAHAWVEEQQLVLTHDAHVVVENVTPHAVVCDWQTLVAAQTP